MKTIPLLIPKIIRHGEGECVELPGEVRHQLLSSADTGGQFGLALSSFEAGGSAAFHPNSREDSWFFIQSGEFDFQLGGATARLRAGDFVFAPRFVPHGYHCLSPEGGTLYRGMLEASDAADSLPQIVRQNEGECVAAFGNTLRLLVPSSATQGRFACYEADTPPLGGPPLHLHEYQSELFIVRLGSFEFLIGDARVQVSEGDVVFAPCGVPHTFRNISSETGRFLSLVLPGDFESFFREAEGLFQRGEVTPLSMGHLGSKYGIRFLPAS